MSNPLSFGLNLSKKASSKPGLTPKRRAVFGDDADSDDEAPGSGGQAEEITELRSWPMTDTGGPGLSSSERKSPSRPGPPKSLSHQPPPSLRLKKPGSITPPHLQLGDLSSAVTARKHAEEAEKDDPTIYDYDAAYDSFKKPARAALSSDAPGAERKPQYMSSLKKMAEVRERDRKIAEDKKMKRERDAEGDEFADKEKFVTEAYRLQQEENRRLEAEERRREEEEARHNESGGMTGFYKQLLDRDDQRQAEIMKAAEEQQQTQQSGSGAPSEPENGEEAQRLKNEADIAREINAKGGTVAINEDGQVVDKRQLLTGGLNVGAKNNADAQRKSAQGHNKDDRRDRGGGRGHFSGGKQAMRDRHSRALEAQYEQVLKRSREEADDERQKVATAVKSRKTESDISSAKQRYLARKKAEAEAEAKGNDNQV